MDILQNHGVVSICCCGFSVLLFLPFFRLFVDEQILVGRKPDLSVPKQLPLSHKLSHNTCMYILFAYRMWQTLRS